MEQKKREKAVLHKQSVAASALSVLLENVDPTVEPKTFRFAPLYSGGPLYVDGWSDPTYVDLTTLKFDPAPKVLVEHDWEQVVGRLVNIQVRNDSGLLSLTADAVVGGTKLAEKVVDCLAVADWVSSLGVYRMEDSKIEHVEEGETAEVNGRTVTGPCSIARTGYLCEGSFVLVGGDGESRAVLASLLKPKKVVVIPKYVCGEKNMTFEEWIAFQGIDPSTLSAEELAEWQKKYEDDIVTAAGSGLDPVDELKLEEIVVDAVDAVVEELPEEDAAVVQEVTTEIVEEIVDDIKDEFEASPLTAALMLSKIALSKVKARLRASKKGGPTKVSAAAKLVENRRVSAIRELCSAYGREGTKICATAIDEGWTAARTKNVIEATLEKRKLVAKLHNPGVGSLSRHHDGPRPRDILVAALAMTCGMKPETVKKTCNLDDRVIDAAMGSEYRRTTLRTVVAASNNSIRPGSFGVNTPMWEAYRECKANCSSLTAAAKLPPALGGLSVQAAFSTINAIDVFTSVFQAFLEPAAQTADPIWQHIAKTNTLSDLNQVKSYSPTLMGRLKEISATGKIEHVGFETKEFEQQAKANAATFVLPYMMIVNDQIDVFADLLQQFSELPNTCIEHDLAELVWRAVDGDLKAGDGQAFCSTTRGNLYLTGASSEVGATTVTKMKEMLDSMTNAAGVPLAPGGEILLVPTVHGPGAKQMYSAEWIYDKDERSKNIWQDVFTPVIWQWLNASVARLKKDDGSTASRFNASGAFTPFMLLRDPQRRPAFCVNKVMGYESPILDQFENADDWGIAYRLIHPYSVSAKHTDGIVVCAKA